MSLLALVSCSTCRAGDNVVVDVGVVQYVVGRK